LGLTFVSVKETASESKEFDMSRSWNQAIGKMSQLANLRGARVSFVRLARSRRHDAGTENPSSNGIGAWIVVTVLLLLLIAAGAIAYFGWTISNADVPISGYVAMTLGVIFSLAVGIGLMALVFYSSRKGYDEPAMLIQGSGEANEFETHLEQKR
jgi:hypothetical protein